MGDLVKFKKPKPAEKNRGRTLCAHGFHKWRVDGERKFDVKQGRLVTVMRCQRCGAHEHRLT